MLSPSPVSLFCTLLLCLPLALIYTVTTPTTTPTAASTAASAVRTGTTGRHSEQIPVSRFVHTTTKSVLIQQKSRNNPTTSPPPPISPEVEDGGDDDDDEMLLRVAARVKRKPSTPRKVAFMFLTTTPLPTAPLWELFFAGAGAGLYNVYVHADPSFPYDPPFGGVFSGRVIKSKPTHRFTPTLAAAARRLLARALLHDRANSVFALLSSSCVPLHSFNFTYATLAASRRSFIEILENQTETYGRWAARGEHAMLPEVGIGDFRIGSQFFAVVRRHARLIVKDRRMWRKFALPCEDPWACYPEENYFPTLLNTVDPRGCVSATLTHVDWRGRTDGHPHTYEASEVGPELIRRLRNQRPRYGDEDGANGSDSLASERRRLGQSHRPHPFLFARKFGADAIEPLMKIASDVILKD